MSHKTKSVTAYEESLGFYSSYLTIKKTNNEFFNDFSKNNKQEDLLQKNRHYLGMFCSQCMLISITIELMLKSFLLYENKIAKSHNLLKLYEELSLSIRRDFESFVKKRDSDFNVIEFLQKENNNFIEWRYMFEDNQSGKNISFKNTEIFYEHLKNYRLKVG
jgi:hypothetical protein